MFSSLIFVCFDMSLEGTQLIAHLLQLNIKERYDILGDETTLLFFFYTNIRPQPVGY